MKFEEIRSYYNQHQKLNNTTNDGSLLKITLQYYIAEVLEICFQDENFATYTAREQSLAFHFTLLQQLANDEKLVNEINIFQIQSFNILNSELKDFNTSNIEYGSSIGEIQKRLFIDQYYSTMLSLCTFYILDFWKKDNSINKEKSDVAIDKIINWAYDIMAPNALDSSFTLIQFILQNLKDGRTK
jgi:hypothetical protein